MLLPNWWLSSRRGSPRWRRSRIRAGFTRSSSFCRAFQRWSFLRSLSSNSSETAAVLKKRNTRPWSRSTPYLTKYRSPTSWTGRADRSTNTRVPVWPATSGNDLEAQNRRLQMWFALTALHTLLLFVCIYVKQFIRINEAAEGNK